MKAIYFILLYTALWVALTRPAHAYLDPGTGSMFLQVLVAMVLGSLAGGRAIYVWVKHHIVSGTQRRSKAPANKQSDEAS